MSVKILESYTYSFLHNSISCKPCHFHMEALKWPIFLWKLFYHGSAFNSIYSQLKSMKLYTSIVYDILHMLWKFEGKYYNESWDIKRCINGDTLSNFINFGSFSVHLQTDITQYKMYVQVSFWCHRKAHGLVSYFMKYQQPRIKSWFTNDT